MASHTPAVRTGLAISLKGRALRLLTGREHSRAELERKLALHAESPEQLAQVLDELQAKDFISEARVVASVINRKQAKLGASRIKRELQGKGIDADVVANAMGELKATELQRARARSGARNLTAKPMHPPWPTSARLIAPGKCDFWRQEALAQR